MGTLTPDWMLMKEPRGGRAAGGGAGSALSQVLEAVEALLAVEAGAREAYVSVVARC